MQTVTRFDSVSKEEEDPLSDYQRLLESLDRTSLEVVENHFSRISKKSLRGQLTDALYVTSKDAREVRPLWVCEWSVVIDIPELTDRTEEGVKDICLSLKRLVDGVAATVKSSQLKEAKVTFVDSLSTRITQVGPRTLRFILKQKWWPHAS